jgi:hypothetical protein
VRVFAAHDRLNHASDHGRTLRTVITRGALFAAWAFVGLVLSYGALYAFTPFGLLVIGACLFAACALPVARGSRWPEVLGLLAGPALFLLVVG